MGNLCRMRLMVFCTRGHREKAAFPRSAGNAVNIPHFPVVCYGCAAELWFLPVCPVWVEG